jgi:hypothetical protein
LPSTPSPTKSTLSRWSEEYAYNACDD